MESELNPQFLIFDSNYLFNLVIPLIGLTLLYSIYKLLVKNALLVWKMSHVHKHCEHIKEELFKEAIKHVTCTSIDNINNGKLDILEIGVGAGKNFEYYPENANLQIMDISYDFLPYLKESFKVRPDLHLHSSNVIVSKAEHMEAVQSSSLDMLVHTFALSSVDDCELVNSEICRVLKPGGVRLFIEFTESKGQASRIIQWFLGPIWYLLFDCRFENTEQIILKTSGEFHVVSKKLIIKNRISIVESTVVYGYAVKNKTTTAN